MKNKTNKKGKIRQLISKRQHLTLNLFKTYFKISGGKYPLLRATITILLGGTSFRISDISPSTERKHI